MVEVRTGFPMDDYAHHVSRKYLTLSIHINNLYEGVTNKADELMTKYLMKTIKYTQENLHKLFATMSRNLNTYTLHVRELSGNWLKMEQY